MPEVSKRFEPSPNSVPGNFYEQVPFSPTIEVVAEKHNGLFVPSLRILVSRFIKTETANALKVDESPNYDQLDRDLKDPKWIALQRKNWLKGVFKSANVVDYMQEIYLQALASLNSELSSELFWKEYVGQWGIHYRNDGSIIPNRAHITQETPTYISWLESKIKRSGVNYGLAEVLPEGYVSRSVVKATNPRNPQHSGRNPRTGIKIIEDYS